MLLETGHKQLYMAILAEKNSKQLSKVLRFFFKSSQSYWNQNNLHSINISV